MPFIKIKTWFWIFHIKKLLSVSFLPLLTSCPTFHMWWVSKQNTTTDPSKLLVTLFQESWNTWVVTNFATMFNVDNHFHTLSTYCDLDYYKATLMIAIHTLEFFFLWMVVLSHGWVENNQQHNWIWIHCRFHYYKGNCLVEVITKKHRISLKPNYKPLMTSISFIFVSCTTLNSIGTQSI